MPLSPNARILTGGDVTREARNNRLIVVVVTATFTPDLGVTELVFPDPNVSFVIPRLGTVALRLANNNEAEWTEPVDVRLTEQLILGVPELLDLDSISLVPSPGCQLDAISRYAR